VPAPEQPVQNAPSDVPSEFGGPGNFGP